MKNTANRWFILIAVALPLAVWFAGCASAPTPLTAELKPLQGHWEGDGSGGKCFMTITGNSLLYRAGTNWFKTTFTLPVGTSPPQLHATIIDCSPPTKDSVGKVVYAIYQVGEGKLLIAEDDMSGKPPKDFLSATSHYELKLVQDTGRVKSE